MKQQGFTLIELVVVIVILGVLAATAAPRIFDFEGDARQSAIRGVAGGISTAFAINFAARQMGEGVSNIAEVNLCLETPIKAVMTSVDVSNYNITGTVACTSEGGVAVKSGTPGDCTLTDKEDTTVTATFQAICTN